LQPSSKINRKIRFFLKSSKMPENTGKTAAWLVGTPRTGSTVLCDMLDQTEYFGVQFDEYYNPKRPVHPKGRIPRCGKLLGYQVLENFPNWDLTPFERQYPNLRWVFLFRRERLEQAVSDLIANLTGVWNQGDPRRLDEYRTRSAPWRPALFGELYSAILKDHRRLRAFFQQRTHLRVAYEDLAADVMGTFHLVADYLGVPTENRNKVRIRKQKLNHPEREQLSRLALEWYANEMSQ